MKKRILSMVLVLCLALSLAVLPVSAAATETNPAAAAEQLHALGVLNGTGGSDGYALDRVLTRQEAAAMLVRLIGLEDFALSGNWYAPFDTVDSWALPYVGCAWVRNFVSPAADGSFRGSDPIDGVTFRSYLLRALGYATGGDTAREEKEAQRLGLPAASEAPITRGQAAVMTLAACEGNNMNLWTETAPARVALESYIAAITDQNNPDFIPVEDRIAVFDLDGTLYCETDPAYLDHMLYYHRVFEDPSYQPTEEQVKIGEDIREYMETGVYPSGMDEIHAKANAEVFAGLTVEEYMNFIRDYMATPANSYTGMTKGEAFYQPMLQLIRYIQRNGFTVYIVSGSNRVMLRALVEDAINIPPSQIIGTDENIVSSTQGSDINGLKYVYGADDTLVMAGSYIFKNLKMNKVSVIAREIGKQPVLSFGNSSGDASMANYTIMDNPHRSLAFMLLCDDLVRENGNESKADSMRSSCEKNGWIPVSMRDDWTTIYGENVTRTASAG